MVDSRHGFTDLDRKLLDVRGAALVTGEVKLLVLLTKADKLNRREAQQALDDGAARARAAGHRERRTSASRCSPRSTGAALDDAAMTLHQWAHPEPAS